MLLLAREDTLKWMFDDFVDYAPFCKQEFIGYLIHYHKQDLRKENPEGRLPENDDQLLILLSIELHMDRKNGLDDLLISVKKWVLTSVTLLIEPRLSQFSFSKPLLAEVKMQPEVPGGKMRRSDRLKKRDDKKPY